MLLHTLDQMLDKFHFLLTLCCVFPAILFLGIYLTIKLKGIQFTKIKKGFFLLFEKDSDNEGSISNLEAISAVLAGNLGTGNISGVAVALTVGGPGAIVWMWLMAVFGSIIKYAGCVLGLKYRKQNAEGEYVGGPMYYLSSGLGFRTLAMLFALFTIFSALTVGNLVQVNSITLPMHTLGINPLWIGIVLSVFVGVVIKGGVHRFATVATAVVPIMAAFYLGVALIILYFYSGQVIPAFQLILRSAFDFTALSGGVFGYLWVRALTTGFDRGVFATDAGVGLAPILQAGARVKCPVEEGIVAMLAPWIVMVICTITSLVLIVTGAWQGDLQSTNMCMWAFSEGIGHAFGGYVVIISLVLFAFTTILAWAYCAEKAVEFLFGTKKVRYFEYLFILIIPFGTFAKVELVWSLADISISLMLLVNLIGIFFLLKEVVQESTKKIVS